MGTYKVGPDGTVRWSSEDNLREYTKFKRDQDLSFQESEDKQRRSLQLVARAHAIRLAEERAMARHQSLITLEQQLLDLGRLAGMPHAVVEAWAKRVMNARWDPFERARLSSEN